MKILNTFMMLMACLAIAAQAQDDNEQTKPTRAAATKSSQVNTLGATAAVPNRPGNPGQSAPGSLSARPETVLTLCCGSVDPHDMTGSNCAYMHTGQGCAGFILACPKGSKDTVTEDGSGYCKSGD